MKITNNAGLPDSIVEAVRNDTYEPGDGDISATTLIAPPQIRILRKQHSGDIVEDVADRIYALFGQAMHTVLERAEPSAIVEKRLYMEMNGWKLSGQFDRLMDKDGVLQDYKQCSVWEWIYGIKQDRINQLNVLAELCEQNGHSINKIEVVMIFRDWMKSKAKFSKEGEYPPCQVAVVEVPLWESDKRNRYISERVILHQQAEKGRIVDCTPDEMWEKPTKWAVMKKGRKSALKLCDSMGEAEEWIKANEKGDSIDVRHGVKTRCEDYCSVSQFCSQYAKVS